MTLRDDDEKFAELQRNNLVDYQLNLSQLSLDIELENDQYVPVGSHCVNVIKLTDGTEINNAFVNAMLAGGIVIQYYSWNEKKEADLLYREFLPYWNVRSIRELHDPQ